MVLDKSHAPMTFFKVGDWVEWDGNENERQRHFSFITPGKPYRIKGIEDGQHLFLDIPGDTPSSWGPCHWKSAKMTLITEFIKNMKDGI